MSTRLRHASGALFVALAAGCASPSLTTNVPPERLSDVAYESPGGEFRLARPRLVEPGAQIHESTGPGGWVGVVFADELGGLYAVECAPLEEPRPTLADVAAQFEEGDLLAEKSTLTTRHGETLFLLGVHEGASPLRTDTGPLDLVEGWYVFLHGDRMFTRKAGRTVTGDRPEDLFGVVTERLRALLEGLEPEDPPMR